jgi:hypothetical protein
MHRYVCESHETVRLISIHTSAGDVRVVVTQRAAFVVLNRHSDSYRYSFATRIFNLVALCI